MKSMLALAAALLAADGFAAEPSPWPRFRGPNGSGVADGQKPPVQVGPEKNVKWKVPVPGGLSSPIVAGDKLVLAAFDDGKLFTIAYSRADGKEAWRAQAAAKQIEPYYKAEGSPAASTPATDGERIVSYFGSCGLICYDLGGKELWKFELPPPQMGGNFGSGVSPIIAGDVVVLVRDELKGARIIAVELATGKKRWESPRQSPTAYATPIVWDTPEGKQVVAAGHGRMAAYDLGSGVEKWYVAGMPSGVCASPVAAGGALFFAGWSPGGDDAPENQMPTWESMLKQLDKNNDGVLTKDEAGPMFAGFFDSMDANRDGKISRDEYDAVVKFMRDGVNSAFAVKAGAVGDAASHVLWKKTKGLPYVASAIAYRGQLVTVRDGGLVSAFDLKTGKDVYLLERAAAGGRYYASPVAANGHIYFVSLDDGAVTVLKGGAAKAEVVAKNPKLGERVAATPAIADDTLYLRTDKHLWAFGEAK